MANKTVKLDIVVKTTSLANAVRTANQSSRKMADQWIKDQVKITQHEEKELAKRQRMYEKLFNERAKLEDKAAAKAISSAKAVISAQNARGSQILHGAGLGTQALGLTKTGYALRMSGMMGIGTSSLGAMSGASLAGTGLAIAGIGIASKLVETGLQELASIVTSTAGSFMGAMASLGGAKNLQESIEASARRDALVSTAKLSVRPAEQLSRADLTSRAESMSQQGSGQSTEDWLKTFANLASFSGKQKSYTTEDYKFLEQMGGVSRDESGKPDIAGSAKMFAMLTSQGNSSDTAKSIMRNNFAIGQATSLSPHDVLANSDIAGQIAEIGGTNNEKKWNQTIGVMGTIKGYTGDASLAKTQTEAIFAGLRKAHMSGHDIGHWTDDKMDDFNDSIVQASKMTDTQLKKSGFGTRKEGAMGISSIEASASAKGISVEELLKSNSSVTMSTEELNGQFKETIQTIETLSMAFNTITNTLADSTKPVFDALSAAFGDFSKTIPGWKNDLQKAFLEFATVGAYAGKVLLDFGQVVALLMETLAPAVHAVSGTAHAVDHIGRVALSPFDIFHDKSYLDKQEKSRDTRDKLFDESDKTIDKAPGKFADGLDKVSDALETFVDRLNKTGNSVNGQGNAPSEPNTSSGLSLNRNNHPLDQG